MNNAPVLGEIIVTLQSEDKHYDYSRLSVSYESSDKEILDALAPVILEEEGFDLRSEIDNQAFTIKRADNSRICYVFPKSVAGIVL